MDRSRLNLGRLQIRQSVYWVGNDGIQSRDLLYSQDIGRDSNLNTSVNQIAITHLPLLGQWSCQCVSPSQQTLHASHLSRLPVLSHLARLSQGSFVQRVSGFSVSLSYKLVPSELVGQHGEESRVPYPLAGWRRTCSKCWVKWHDCIAIVVNLLGFKLPDNVTNVQACFPGASTIEFEEILYGPVATMFKLSLCSCLWAMFGPFFFDAILT